METGQSYIHPFNLLPEENRAISLNTNLKYNQFMNSSLQYNDINTLRQADFDQLGNNYQQEQVLLEPTIDPMQINGPVFNNAIHMNDEIQYGHFAVTTARYNDPWAFQQVSNYAQFLPQQNNSFKGNFDFSQFQNLPNNQNYGPILPVNDALMHPPPSPNLLSYYMYDNMPHFQNRQFNNTMQMTGFWGTNPNVLNNQQGVVYNNGQYVRQQTSLNELQQPLGQPFNVNRNQSINQSTWMQNQAPISLNTSFINGQPTNYKYNFLQNSNQLGSSFQSLNGIDSRSGYPMMYDRHNVLPMSNSFSHFDMVNTSIYSSGPVTMQPSIPTSMSMQYRMVPGTQIPIEEARSTQWRDHIMQIAHNLYTSTPQSPVLIPMLLVLNHLHPDHLPLLLLIACVYYAQGNNELSLDYHQAILKIDPNYVEAMSNIGTTLKSLGDEAQAELWWRRAINLKPSYWDAVENLLGLLTVSKPFTRNVTNSQTATPQQPRYSEAHNLCCFVEKSVLGNESFTDFCKSVTQRLPYGHISRFQSLVYSKANICSTTGKLAEARVEYEKVVQLLCGGTTVMELISKILSYFFPEAMVPSAEDLSNFNFSNAGNLLIPPQACSQLSTLLFADSGGVPPGLASIPRTGKGSINGSSMDPYTMALHITSTTLLALAKIYQDAYVNPVPLPILLPLYYLSLALYPTPSTCNNLGIVLSNIQVPPSSVTTQDGQKPLTGPNLALQYYTYGLQLDSNHPHLYTNLGSLLKDMGNVNEAINMYHRAVECNPKFDVALVNLGNAYKDSSRIQESIHWYSRAVELNPNFTEAVCGLVGSLSGICDWTHRNSQYDSKNNLLVEGWMDKIVNIVNKQLGEGSEWGRGVVFSVSSPTKCQLIQELASIFNRAKPSGMWKSRSADWWKQVTMSPVAIVNEGSWTIRSVEHATKVLQQLWYKEFYSTNHWSVKINVSQLSPCELDRYRRPTLPKLPVTPIPTVLPFHTFTYPLSPRQVRIISHRNALRISHTILSSTWLPKTVYPPPPPPANRLKIGYVSSDFNNHPLAHLMQSVFGFHNEKLFDVYLYATSPPDKSPYRAKIQSTVRNFLDVTTWSVQAITEQIVNDGIHILVNLNGYTKGARNEIFAARPAPILMAYMGFAGSLGGTWCDWFIADPVVCPPHMVQSDQRLLRSDDENEFCANGQFTPLDLDPEEASEDWVYTEKLIYLPHSYFVNDHRQGFRDPDDPKYTEDNTVQPHPLTLPLELTELNWVHEEARRWRMRTEIFPNLDSNAVIFANFNQLYKLDPVIFDGWLEILRRVENAVLWLLRFPVAGEPHLLNLAKLKAGDAVARRILFTDIAPKNIHIHRGRVADIFLDTPECNAHTTAADILWSGTPIVTFPRHTHKMCSRVAASIAHASGYGKYMVTDSQQSYVERAVYLAKSLRYEHIEATSNAVVLSRLNLTSSTNLPPEGPVEIHRLGQGELMQLRKALFLTRDHSRLFDTPRWVRNLEKGYVEAWNRWAQDQEDMVVQLTSIDTTSHTNTQLNQYTPTNYLQPEFINHLNNHLSDSKKQGLAEVKSACIWVQDDEDDLQYTLRLLDGNLNSKVENPADNVDDHAQDTNTGALTPTLLYQQIEETKLVFNSLTPGMDSCPTPAS